MATNFRPKFAKDLHSAAGVPKRIGKFHGAMITLYRVEIRQACRAGKITKQQFIHSVNSDGSQTANIIFDIFYVT